MCVDVAEEGQCGGSVVAGEQIIEGDELCVFKFCEELITEDSVNITTSVVLSTLFGILAEECLLVRGGCPRWDAGCATGVGRVYYWVSVDEGVFFSRKDEPKVAVLAPSTGTLD